VPLFEGLSKRELAAVERLGTEVSFDAGQPVVREGERAVAFHLILSGRARVTVGGRSRATLGPGDFFGELSLIDRGPRTATVVATTPLRTFTLASWDFLPLLERSPSIARKLLIEMCRRLRRVDRSLTH
jgi:CRP/FNR family cyclic AMP-dependent transcriptional regulator